MIRRLRPTVLCLSIAFVVIIQSARAQDEFSQLAKRIPSTANALVILNIEETLNSPLARQQQWQLKSEAAFKSGMIILPPKATRFMLASEFDLEVMEPRWEIAVAHLKDGPQTREIAEKHGTTVDNIRGKPSVPLSSNAYVVKFDVETYGAIAPADRQTTARWIGQSVTATKPSISPYLQEAVGFSDRVGTEIIMALALHDVLSPDVVRGHLGKAETLAGKNVDLDALARAIAGIRGLTLGILIDKGVTGSLKVDFKDDVSMMAAFAKPLLLEALGNHGSMIDDFKDWRVTVQGTQVRLSGPLSETGLRQVLSVMDARTSSFISPSQQGSGQGGDDPTVEASLRYFNSIQILLEDLEGLKSKTKTWGQKAGWYDKYARKIDGLPMLNVDKDLLDYGQYVSFALRDASGALKEIGSRSRYRQVNTAPIYRTNYAVGYGWGPYGYGWRGAYRSQEDLRATGREKSRVRTEEKLRGTSKANAIVVEIEKATAEVRRMMTERYKAQF